MKSLSVTIQMKTYWAVLSCDAVYYAVQGGSNFCLCRRKSLCVTIQMKATEQYFPVVLFIMLYNVYSVMQWSLRFPNIKGVTVPATGFAYDLRFLRAIETIFVN